MKKLLSFALITMAALSLSANGHSLYKKDTDADKMARVVSLIADDKAIPFFVHRDNLSLYSSQIDPRKLEGFTLPVDKMDESLSMGRMSDSEYARMTLIPVADSDSRVCMITFARDKIDMVTFVHEALHCKTSKHWDDDDYINLAGVAYVETKPDVSPSVYLNYFEEALVAHLTVAYAMNAGLDGMDEIRALNKIDKNVSSSIGIRTARNAVQVCGEKGACSLDVMTIANQMMNSPGFIQALKQDAEELSELQNLAALGVRK